MNTFFARSVEKIEVFAVLATIAVGTTGCISGPEATAMTPRGLTLHGFPGKMVRLHVTGYNNPDLVYKIDAQPLHSAIQQAIISSHLFSGVVSGGAADMTLDVKLESVSAGGGLAGTYHAVVSWKLTDTRSGRVLYDEMLLSEGPQSTAASGPTRVREATENALRASIQNGLDQISRMAP